MAVDPRIERFSLDLFLRKWDIGSREAMIISDFMSKLKLDEQETDVTEDIAELVDIRILSFRKTMCEALEKDYELFSSDGVVLYHYLRKNMDRRHFPYPNMNIFDRLLMSCAVVVLMGGLCCVHEDYGFIVFAPRSWAMYFEMMWKDEFYARGGFEMLDQYAFKCNNDLKSKLEESALYDFLNVERVFELYTEKFDFSIILETFALKRKNRDCPSCSKCLPLFDVLLWISKCRIEPDRTKHDRVGDCQIIEGYLQILFRTLKEDAIKNLCLDAMKMMMGPNNEEKAKMAESKVKEVLVLSLKKRIFKEAKGRDGYAKAKDELDSEGSGGSAKAKDKLDTDGSDGSAKAKDKLDTDGSAKAKDDSNLCIFCCEVVDEGSHAYLKSTIRRKAKEVVPSKRDSKPSEEDKALREVEKMKKLRMFLALGDEPTLNKVKANIEEEFGMDRNLIEGCNKETLPNDSVLEELEELELSPKKKMKKN